MAEFRVGKTTIAMKNTPKSLGLDANDVIIVKVKEDGYLIDSSPVTMIRVACGEKVVYTYVPRRKKLAMAIRPFEKKFPGRYAYSFGRNAISGRETPDSLNAGSKMQIVAKSKDKGKRLAASVVHV